MVNGNLHSHSIQDAFYVLNGKSGKVQWYYNGITNTLWLSRLIWRQVIKILQKLKLKDCFYFQSQTKAITATLTKIKIKAKKSSYCQNLSKLDF